MKSMSDEPLLIRLAIQGGIVMAVIAFFGAIAAVALGIIAWLGWPDEIAILVACSWGMWVGWAMYRGQSPD